MNEELLRPRALAVTMPTSPLVVVPGATRTVNAIVLGASLLVSPTNASAGEPPDLALDARRAATQRTNSGGVLADDARTERSSAEAVLEIRRRSGLTWEQVASLFGVERRSVHLWASGRPLSAINQERVSRVLALLRRVDRGTPSATRSWLVRPTAGGELPLDMIRDGRFDDLELPARAPARARPGKLSTAAKNQRAPRPPEELVASRTDRVHVDRGVLVRAVPLVRKPKK